MLAENEYGRLMKIFEKIVWQDDRMLLEDLVFRLEEHKGDNWELAQNCFMFHKNKRILDQYAAFWKHKRAFSPRHILELGIWDGGSVAFWCECFHPQKFVAIDNKKATN